MVKGMLLLSFSGLGASACARATSAPIAEFISSGLNPCLLFFFPDILTEGKFGC